MAARRAALLWLLATSCATARTEWPPGVPLPDPEPDVVVERGRAALWRTAVPCLARRFFVDRADAASGTVTLSYAGEAAPYVEGLTIAGVAGPAGVHLTRALELEAWAEVVLEPIERTRTRAAVRARYAVTRRLTGEWQGRSLQPDPETVSFRSGQPGRLSAPTDQRLVRAGADVLWPTGRLEAEVLSCFR